MSQNVRTPEGHEFLPGQSAPWTCVRCGDVVPLNPPMFVPCSAAMPRTVPLFHCADCGAALYDQGSVGDVRDGEFIVCVGCAPPRDADEVRS